MKRKLGIPDHKRVVLYPPTWRDGKFYGLGENNLSLKFDLGKFQAILGKDTVTLLRLHFYIAYAMDISSYKGFAFDVSKYDDIAELHLIFDVMITDYSSVLFDFANLKKPILFYTYDLEKYRDKLRGFYLDMETEASAPLIKEENELHETLKNLDVKYAPYEKKLLEFNERFCAWKKGIASKYVNPVKPKLTFKNPTLLQFLGNARPSCVPFFRSFNRFCP